jgi:hypothetical protein
MRVHQTQTRIMAGRIWTSYRLTVGIDRRPAANRYRYFARVDIDILLASIAIFYTCPYRYYARFDIDIWHAPISIFCQLRYDIFASVDIDAYMLASISIFCTFRYRYFMRLRLTMCESILQHTCI